MKTYEVTYRLAYADDDTTSDAGETLTEGSATVQALYRAEAFNAVADRLREQVASALDSARSRYVGRRAGVALRPDQWAADTVVWKEDEKPLSWKLVYPIPRSEGRAGGAMLFLSVREIAHA